MYDWSSFFTSSPIVGIIMYVFIYVILIDMLQPTFWGKTYINKFVFHL